LLATGGLRGIVKVINCTRKIVSRTIIGHGNSINDIHFHPVDPSLLLTASKDESVRLWNVATGVCIAVFAGLFALFFVCVFCVLGVLEIGSFSLFSD
jgi:polycomb protein EED